MEQRFFGLPEEEDWILMGHMVNRDDGYILDRTLIYLDLGYQLSHRIGPYASRTQFVEVSINDDYLGVYVFMEKLKRDGDRIDVDRLSTYLQKERGGKLAMGPIWDLNIGYDTGDRIPFDFRASWMDGAIQSL